MKYRHEPIDWSIMASACTFGMLMAMILYLVQGPTMVNEGGIVVCGLLTIFSFWRAER